MIIKAVVVVWLDVSLYCGCGCSQRVAAAAVPPRVVEIVAVIVPPGVVAVLPSVVAIVVVLADAAPSFHQRAGTAIQGGGERGERRSKELYYS